MIFKNKYYVIYSYIDEYGLNLESDEIMIIGIGRFKLNKASLFLENYKGKEKVSIHYLKKL